MKESKIGFIINHSKPDNLSMAHFCKTELIAGAFCTLGSVAAEQMDLVRSKDCLVWAKPVWELFRRTLRPERMEGLGWPEANLLFVRDANSRETLAGGGAVVGFSIDGNSVVGFRIDVGLIISGFDLLIKDSGILKDAGVRFMFFVEFVVVCRLGFAIEFTVVCRLGFSIGFTVVCRLELFIGKYVGSLVVSVMFLWDKITVEFSASDSSGVFAEVRSEPVDGFDALIVLPFISAAD